MPRSLTSLALGRSAIDTVRDGSRRGQLPSHRVSLTTRCLCSPEDDKVVDVVVGRDELILRLSVLGSSRVDCRTSNARRGGEFWVSSDVCAHLPGTTLCSTRGARLTVLE